MLRTNSEPERPVNTCCPSNKHLFFMIQYNYGRISTFSFIKHFCNLLVLTVYEISYHLILSFCCPSS